MADEPTKAADTTDDTPSLEQQIEQAMARLRQRSPRELPPEGLSREEQLLRRIEALLFAADAPMSAAALRKALPDADIQALMPVVERRWAGRGVVLARAGGSWHFTTAPDLAHELQSYMPAPPARLSGAAQEVLAIIAYHQPCTRADIEAVRGVPVQRGTLDALMERGWVEPRGHRHTPGRPMTFGVTARFLADLGLESVQDLPGRAELAAAGLLSPHLPADFVPPLAGEELPDRDASVPLEMEEDFVTDYLQGEADTHH